MLKKVLLFFFSATALLAQNEQIDEATLIELPIESLEEIQFITSDSDGLAVLTLESQIAFTRDDLGTVSEPMITPYLDRFENTARAVAVHEGVRNDLFLFLENGEVWWSADRENFNWEFVDALPFDPESSDFIVDSAGNISIIFIYPNYMDRYLWEYGKPEKLELLDSIQGEISKVFIGGDHAVYRNSTFSELIIFEEELLIYSDDNLDNTILSFKYQGQYVFLKENTEWYFQIKSVDLPDQIISLPSSYQIDYLAGYNQNSRNTSFLFLSSNGVPFIYVLDEQIRFEMDFYPYLNIRPTSAEINPLGFIIDVDRNFGLLQVNMESGLSIFNTRFSNLDLCILYRMEGGMFLLYEEGIIKYGWDENQIVRSLDGMNEVMFRDYKDTLFVDSNTFLWF